MSHAYKEFVTSFTDLYGVLGTFIYKLSHRIMKLNIIIKRLYCSLKTTELGDPKRAI